MISQVLYVIFHLSTKLRQRFIQII